MRGGGLGRPVEGRVSMVETMRVVEVGVYC